MQVSPYEQDALEAAAWRDLFDAAPPALRRELGLEAVEVGPALVLRSTGLDHLLFNRAIGLGSATAPQDRELSAILEGYRERGIARYFIHVHEGAGSDGLRHRLERFGLAPYRRSWWKYARGREAPRPARTPHPIVPAAPEHGEAIGRLFCHGFDAPEAAAPLLAPIVRRPGWHPYVALDGSRVAGMGALYVRRRFGYLAFAVTEAAYRRRGIQGALMARRIHTALELGCEVLVTETGEEVPGEPNPSGDNMVRHGFRVVGRRHNYAPRGVAWPRRRPE
ncbi:MAG: GNAT family N-acetyltransferase [Myxococcota bacterium]